MVWKVGGAALVLCANMQKLKPAPCIADMVDCTSRKKQEHGLENYGNIQPDSEISLKYSGLMRLQEHV